jgi:hypothetical protein
MPTIIDNRTQLDQTVRIFDTFYSTNLVVGADQYDIVFSYFTSVCATKKIAANFSAVLFRIAQESGVNVLDLLATIQGAENKLQMNKIICYYLNSFKSKTSLYGVGIIPRPVQPVARNIVQ